ncbi:6,7-dimethyl-8-ribityllumazine synthase [Stenotrophobium rhamnosiphilum]|uniref:6,7-dimethyl-8-ribityllumazine synthase n=1 Tax=Stenotrophobium rhamnosiphilum TaxID=2029166 RepID=A0A2T5MHE6_9GAMM|nr:6,7-dimethyl-8-ribityllumazine synthase [Stenotrophobium rhamnosiphilum]PTU32000.1 6,7-dimethyl-8-ribityllumazine synthase [Stenotrophobium rhamnosiphilum]
MKSGYAAPEKPASGEFADARIAIVATRWNVEIVDALLDGSYRCLEDWGVPEESVEEFYVPGAYEIPLAVSLLLESGDYDGVITLGAVIRGDTPHFDFVAGECSRGLMDAQLRHSLPVGFGVLTVNTVQQAIDRTGDGDDNKGYEAAAAVLEMVRLTRSLA